MNQNGARLLVITVLGSLLLGVGVLVFDEDYTIEANVRSNEDYCPTIEPYWEGSPRPEGTDARGGRTDRPAGRDGAAE